MAFESVEKVCSRNVFNFAVETEVDHWIENAVDHAAKTVIESSPADTAGADPETDVAGQEKDVSGGLTAVNEIAEGNTIHSLCIYFI